MSLVSDKATRGFASEQEAIDAGHNILGTVEYYSDAPAANDAMWEPKVEVLGVKVNPEDYDSPPRQAPYPDPPIAKAPGKVRVDLVTPQFIEDVARVMGFGAGESQVEGKPGGRYKAHDWEKGIPLESVLAAGMRHILKMQRGELIDPESGLCHASHAAANMMMAHWMIMCTTSDAFSLVLPYHEEHPW